MGIESIMAIQDCMSFLGLKPNDQPSFDVSARIKNMNKRTASGEIDVTFWSNAYSHEGPYISFDSTIRGYGIQFEEFKPEYQNFIFIESTKTLEVEGNDYKFQLIFS